MKWRMRKRVKGEQKDRKTRRYKNVRLGNRRNGKIKESKEKEGAYLLEKEMKEEEEEKE